MFTKIFSKKPVFEDKVKAEIEKYFDEYKKYINKIDNLLPSYKDISYSMFRDILVRFFRKVYDLPASENHHHSERFGLFVHSLETCINALITQHRKLELKFDNNGDLDSQFNLRNKEKILYRTAIQGLLHDAGKVFDVDVISKKKEIPWDNYDDNLLDFYLRHGAYDIRWHKERTGKHEKRNIIILWQMLETRDRQYLTAYNFIRLIDEFWGYDPVETTRELIKEADILSVKMDYQESLPKEEGKDEIYDIIEAFTASVAEMTDKRMLKVNEKVSDLIVLDTITLILNPSCMQKILNYMQKHYKLKTTREHVVKLMRDKKIVLETETGKTFIHAFITPPGSAKDYKLNFIIIKNKYIWGCNKPENFKGKVIIPEFEIETGSISNELPDEENQMVEEVKESPKPKAINEIEVNKEVKNERDKDRENTPEKKSNKKPQTETKTNKSSEAKHSTNAKDNKSAEQKLKRGGDKTLKEKLYEYVKKENPKKFNIFLKGLSLTLESELQLENIEKVKVGNQNYVVVGYPAGFKEIAKYTGIFDLNSDEKEQYRAIQGYINSLYDAGHLAKIKEFNEKPLIPVSAKKEYEKAILIFEESISAFAN